MAGTIGWLTVTFDSHILSVTDGENTITESGGQFAGAFTSISTTYTCSLSDAYVIDTVTVSNGALVSKTENTFEISLLDNQVDWGVDITSKQSGGGAIK